MKVTDFDGFEWPTDIWLGERHSKIDFGPVAVEVLDEFCEALEVSVSLSGTACLVRGTEGYSSSGIYVQARSGAELFEGTFSSAFSLEELIREAVDDQARYSDEEQKALFAQAATELRAIADRLSA